jgi:hypothetical protein
VGSWLQRLVVNYKSREHGQRPLRLRSWAKMAYIQPKSPNVPKCKPFLEIQVRQKQAFREHGQLGLHLSCRGHTTTPDATAAAIRVHTGK